MECEEIGIKTNDNLGIAINSEVDEHIVINPHCSFLTSKGKI
jgi:hypothetical protein